ncbi:hypothetical protein B0J11DRAFT_499115 [Dendryphion nanum]|uniref:C2H2-type domain-containing protein n=1 Tax=Dendryphion nanum TaxID=256645 RepID=A0A9P9I7D0_9PLEO|nr:hypothetical protein B0J11DRAFT_499115 [Dendryphion nanum]
MTTTSSINLGPDYLLEYNPQFKILICRECQYAIQKSALQSHLLKHKIYRESKQELLNAIAQFELLEPENVILPPAQSLPISSLPVLDGYRCVAVGCGNLCASSKRMRRHWSEKHTLIERYDLFSQALPVQIQTFFRGTKLRYFEVGAMDINNAKNDKNNVRIDESAQSPPLRIASLQTHETQSPSIVDLQTLGYLHHFTTMTSLTLPIPSNANGNSLYWQADSVSFALRHQWLMCGLLAISSCHLSVLGNDTATGEIHFEQSERLFSEFANGRKEYIEQITIEDAETRLGMQIDCIFRCAQWATTVHQLNRQHPSIEEIVSCFRGFTVCGYSTKPSQDSRFNRNKIFVPANTILKSDVHHSHSESSLLNTLGALPSRMIEAFGKPESTEDVLVTLTANVALVECFAIGFSTTELMSILHGIMKWISIVPDHIFNMIKHDEPAALVLVAYWALLIKRAEQQGCWYMDGLSGVITRLIAENMSIQKVAIRNLLPNV